jgi:hypothetical protein
MWKEKRNEDVESDRGRRAGFLSVFSGALIAPITPAPALTSPPPGLVIFAALHINEISEYIEMIAL